MSLLWRIYDNAFPNAIWIVASRNREGFVRSCLKTDFMSRHSADPSFWHQYAEEYEQRLADLAGAVATHHEVKTDDIIRGDFSGIEHICRAHDLDYTR